MEIIIAGIFLYQYVPLLHHYPVLTCRRSLGCLAGPPPWENPAAPVRGSHLIFLDVLRAGAAALNELERVYRHSPFRGRRFRALLVVYYRLQRQMLQPVFDYS